MPVDAERECPLCGAETVVKQNLPITVRRCTDDDCHWQVAISGSGTRNRRPS